MPAVGPDSRYFRQDATSIAPVQVTDSAGWNCDIRHSTGPISSPCWPSAARERDPALAFSSGRAPGRIREMHIEPVARANASGWSLDRKLRAEAEGSVAEPRCRGPSDRGPVRIGVRRGDAESARPMPKARILRCQEGRWEPKRPALVPRERPANGCGADAGISPGETTAAPFLQSRRRHPRVSTNNSTSPVMAVSSLKPGSSVLLEHAKNL